MPPEEDRGRYQPDDPNGTVSREVADAKFDSKMAESEAKAMAAADRVFSRTYRPPPGSREEFATRLHRRGAIGLIIALFVVPILPVVSTVVDTHAAVGLALDIIGAVALMMTATRG